MRNGLALALTLVGAIVCGAVATATIMIAACDTPVIVADTLMGTVGLPFLSTLAISPNATISVSGLPAGLTLEGNVISGTPTISGTATITATASCGATAQSIPSGVCFGPMTITVGGMAMRRSASIIFSCQPLPKRKGRGA